MRHSLFIYLLITTLLGNCPIVGQTISPQEVIDRLYSPPDGQWLVSGRQVASRSPLWGKVDLERDSPDTIVNEEYSAIVSTSEGNCSIVFRSDSKASFSQSDLYWNSGQFYTFLRPVNTLTVYPPGKKLNFPMDEMRRIVGFGHPKLDTYLLTFPKTSQLSTTESVENKTITVEIRKDYKIVFFVIEGQLVQKGHYIYDPDGSIKIHSENVFSSPPGSLSDVSTKRLGWITIAKSPEPNRHIAQVRRIQMISDARELPADTFVPSPGRIVEVADQRLTSGHLFYRSDLGAVPLEKLHEFAKDGQKIIKYENEVQARSAKN